MKAQLGGSFEMHSIKRNKDTMVLNHAPDDAVPAYALPASLGLLDVECEYFLNASPLGTGALRTLVCSSDRYSRR